MAPKKQKTLLTWFFSPGILWTWTTCNIYSLVQAFSVFLNIISVQYKLYFFEMHLHDIITRRQHALMVTGVPYPIHRPVEESHIYHLLLTKFHSRVNKSFKIWYWPPPSYLISCQTDYKTYNFGYRNKYIVKHGNDLAPPYLKYCNKDYET